MNSVVLFGHQNCQNGVLLLNVVFLKRLLLKALDSHTPIIINAYLATYLL
jgi:hypothetical protein